MVKSFSFLRYVSFLSTFTETSLAVAQLESNLSEVEAVKATIHAHLRPELGEATKEMGVVHRQLQELMENVEVRGKRK